VRALSLFSGAGGLDMGLEAAGVTIVGQCEKDATARSVLRRHWPDTPLHDDVMTLDPEEFRGRVDIVAGGSPCQDLSVAGRRAGLDGARSGLFWHQCRVADSAAAPWVLWENVAGALSSNDGADFASVLWGLTGTLPGVPDGGWRTCGVVVGPKRTAVWRLLDARWFGVAQRRRRVFVVAGPRGRCGPQVLLEPEGLRGNPEPGRAPGQVVAALTANGVGAGGGPDDNAGQAGHLIPEHTGTVTESWGRQCGNTQVDNGQVVAVAEPMPFDTTQITHQENRRNPQPGDPSPSLARGGHAPAIAFHMIQDPISGPESPALGVKSSGMGVAYPIDMRNAMRETSTGAGTQGTGVGEDGDPMFTLTGNTMGRPAVATELAVRRLTPRECERLMGWPDDWTRWRDDGTEVADSQRYRLCGNGVVGSLGEWIGNGMVLSHQRAQLAQEAT